MILLPRHLAIFHISVSARIINAEIYLMSGFMKYTNTPITNGLEINL